ncbi:MoaD/ThiS family protein [Maricaulis sp. D1M11]|uniref:MoaD/ThiS family protein n=1 Tax=Maricaulis sp. D1M11 TaxID=3076117 RepID=UPI0039B462F0
MTIYVEFVAALRDRMGSDPYAYDGAARRIADIMTDIGQREGALDELTAPSLRFIHNDTIVDAQTEIPDNARFAACPPFTGG